MSVVIQAKSKMSFVGIQASSIYGKLLYLNSFQEQKLLQAIVNSLFFKELLELILKMAQVVSFELYS